MAEVKLLKANTVEELLKTCPKNQVIGDNLVRAWSIINKDKYQKICCSISGGSDSDVMLDIIWRCDKDNKVEYVWFDTGLEYQATKKHLKYLEKKYNIQIKTFKAIKPIPVSCKMYGQPFISKQVSENIYRMQKHNFTWEDKSYEDLLESGVPMYLAKWWCNKYQPAISSYNINRNKYLKQFLINNPPSFKISSQCCKYAKKDLNKAVIKEMGYDLMITGVRKAEGGARAAKYKSCFTENDEKCDFYRPLFWYKEADKIDYETNYEVTHSECYTEYGFKRTGCSGCPYNKEVDEDLAIIQEYEPNLYKAAHHIFGDSYEYTHRYREFIKEMDKKKKENKE